MYDLIAYFHLGTILPAFMLGTYLLIRSKGTDLHRLLGKIYMALMLFTGLITLFMPAAVGSRLLNHFGFIHLLSVLTLVTVPTAYFAAKNRNVARHKGSMIGLYVGGILIAGFFAFMPGRRLNAFLFG